MKLALAHDWIVSLGGAENCLAAFHDLYPSADIFTLIFNKESVEKLGFDVSRVHNSFLQHFPNSLKWYRKYLPLYPLAVEQLDLSGYDVILSSSHAVAKGVLTRSDQLHICYCHTPMRYAWDLTHEYLREHGYDRGIKGALARIFLHYIRMWDVQTANRVDYFIANSKYTARRIWRVYRRESTVIYPPVNINKTMLFDVKKEDYFIFVSRLVPYKKADLVIKTFNQLGYPLIVVGDGPDLKKCREMAADNVTVLGYQDNDNVIEYIKKARALVFAAEEDFGIVPVEAQACGTPVIAYGKGGAVETVVPVNDENWDQATGIFFSKQSVESISEAVEYFLQIERKFSFNTMRKNAERFSVERFKVQISDFVREKYSLQE
jgi:glycosyltransferase involved in cell wall biosynthesis